MSGQQAILGRDADPHGDGATVASGRVPDVSLIMPCLNEHESLPHCIANAGEALARRARLIDAELRSARAEIDAIRAGGAAVIEWPERLEGRLPVDRLDIELEIVRGGADDYRQARLIAHGAWEGRPIEF